MNIGDLFIGLKVDPSGELKAEVVKATGAAGDAGAKTLGQHLKAGLGNVMTGVGQGFGQSLAGALGKATHAVTDFVFDSISAASDLNETISKSTTIFGDNEGAIEDWASTAATAMGQSKQQALDTASGFAGLFQTVGIGEDKIVGFSEGMTQMGSDLASFFNTDVQTALDALKSGLNGESEPLRKFNIFLSDAAVQAKATQMGLEKVNGKFTEGAKVTARYQIIMDQTGSAQGDFAKTSDGLANSQRILNAELDDAKAQLGQALLPLMKDLAGVAKQVLGAFNNLSPEAKNLGVALAGLVVVSGPILGMLRGIIGLGGLAAKGLGLVKDAAVGASQAAIKLATDRGAAVAEAEAGGMAKAAGTGAAGGVAAAAGTALGVALGAAALVAIQHGLPALGSVLAEHLAGTDAESRARSAGQQLADGLLKGATDTAKAEFVDKFMAAVASGQTWEQAATTASAQFGGSIGAHLADDTREAMSQSGFATSFENDQALTAAGIAVGETVGTTAGQAVLPAWQAEMDAAATANRNSMAMYQIMTANHDAQTQAAEEIWNASARSITGDMTGTLKSAKDDIGNVMKDLMWAINHPMALEKDILKVQAELNSKTLKDALASKNPEIKAEAEQTRERLLNLWKTYDPSGYAAYASQQLKDSLNNGYPGALADALAFVRDINATFQRLTGKVGLNIQVKGDEQYGHGAGYRATGGRVQRGMPYIVGERRAEWFVPEQNGYVYPSVPDATSSSSKSDVTINIYDATDPQKVGDVVASKLERIFRSANLLPLNRSARPAF